MRKRRKHERNTEPNVQGQELAQDTDLMPEQAEPASELPPEA